MSARTSLPDSAAGKWQAARTREGPSLTRNDSPTTSVTPKDKNVTAA